MAAAKGVAMLPGAWCLGFSTAIDSAVTHTAPWHNVEHAVTVHINLVANASCVSLARLVRLAMEWNGW